MTAELHGALYGLPDVTLAVEPQSLRIMDVNRTGDAFGYARAQILTLSLDRFLDSSRAHLVDLVAAADGRVMHARTRQMDGTFVPVSIRAASSAMAATSPCVLVSVREAPDRVHIEDARGAVRAALAGLDRLSAPPPTSTRPSIRETLPASGGPSSPTLPFNQRATASVDEGAANAQPLPFKPPEVPDLTVEQYAALTVELDASPQKQQETLTLYGITSPAIWRACEAHWTELLHADPTLRKRCLRLVAAFRDKLHKG